MKRCLGPCEGKQEKEAYDKMIEEIHLLLKGKTAALIQTLKFRMQMLSNNYLFEDAQEMKLLLGKIEKYKSKCVIKALDGTWIHGTDPTQIIYES